MKGYKEFLDALGARESGNKYGIENAFGFLGRWQFGKPRLYDAGLSLDNYSPKGMNKRRLFSKKDFLANKENIQDKIMNWHVHNLADSISRKYKGVLGQTVNGVEITLSGLVAGAHLKGLGGVNQFLKGNDNSDALGTKISEYIKKFGGYDLFTPSLKDQIAEIDALSVAKGLENIS
jgi:hypothetical protein